MLRAYIRQVMLEALKSDVDTSKKKKGDDNLLTEPDEVEDRERQGEVNAISTGGASMVSTGAIQGVTTPLGTGPSYPAGRKKKKKKRAKSGDSNWYKATAK